VKPVRQVPAATRAAGAVGALLVYDGDCGFCTSSARWAERGFHHGERVEAWQLLGEGELARLGLTVEDVRQAAWWVGPDGTLARGHRAAGRALQAAGGWRRAAGWPMLVRPTSWLAAAVYRVVVRYRYRLPGGTPACRVDGGAGKHAPGPT
jgi:predicted DCC family thiol-disulfide oxidoreductase YuxK